MSMADLAVDMRREVRVLRVMNLPLGGRGSGSDRGVGGWAGVATLDVVEWIDVVEVECGCCFDRGGARLWCRLARFGVELAAEAIVCSKGKMGEGFCSSSCPTHQSHSTQPRKVAMLPPPTTETGETLRWEIPTKHTTNIITEQTCCTMTVESATRGQKS